MRIKRIIVEKLFGLDDNDFEIECFPDEYVTILYAFNGIGKTTLLRLLYAVLNVKMNILDSVSFKKIQILFDNNDFVLVEKLGDYKNEFQETKCKDLFIYKNTPVYPIKFTVKTGKKIKGYYLRLSEEFAAEVKKNPEEKISVIIGKLKIRRDDDNEVKHVTKWIFKFLAHRFFYLIDLISIEDNIEKKMHQNFYLNILLANKQYRALFSTDGGIAATHGIFENYPRTLDDFYLTAEEQKEVWGSMEMLKKFKMDNYFLAPQLIREDETKEICPIIYSILSRLNPKTSSEELKVSEELKLYHKLINEEFGFMYKNIEFDKKKGLKVVPIYKGDPELEITKLSAGEKKLLILFYNILFESSVSQSDSVQSIVFIDEPETSLHISWQSKLIKNILEVCKKKSIQAIVATHSPDVIDEYENISTEMISKRYKYGDKYFEK